MHSGGDGSVASRTRSGTRLEKDGGVAKSVWMP